MTTEFSRRGFMGLVGAAAVGDGLAMPAIAQNKPIRLGWIASVTGIFATMSQSQDWAFRMGVQDINDAGGIDGRKIEVVMRDSAADPAKAVSFARELVFNGDIDALCGPINSGEALPTLGIVTNAKKLQMIGGAIDQLINPTKYPYAFRNLNTADQWVKIAVETMLGPMKRAKVAIINDNTGYGVLSRDLVTNILAKHGAAPVFKAVVDPNKPDLTDEVLKARDAGADVITEWSSSTGFVARLLNARGDQNWDVPVVGHPSILQPQVASLLNKKSYLDHIYGVGYAHSIVDANGRLPPDVEAFFDRHKDAAHFMGGGLYSLLQGHAAAYIVAAGMRQAASTDSTKVKTTLETMGPIKPPYGPFEYSPTDHNGFKDEGIVLVEANKGLPNGGYPRAQL